MIPLVPALALSITSFLFSVSVIVRAVLPILPSHPLSSSRRDSGGLSGTTSLSPMHRAYTWVAACDLLSLTVFIWEVFAEYLGGLSGSGDAVLDPASAVRLWLTLTFRQTCLFVIIAATLVQVRSKKPVSFGYKQWIIWVPTFFIAAVSTSMVGLLTGIGMKGVFVGIVSFSVVIAALSTTALVYTAATLLAIRRNLPTPSRRVKAWRHATEEKSRRRFIPKEAVEALKDGSSWITSDAGSRRGSISAFSFSTVHSTRAELASTKSDLIADAKDNISCVETDFQNDIKKLPEPVGPPLVTGQGQNTSSHRLPHIRVVEENEDSGDHSKVSQHDNSWLNEPSVSQTTMSFWSFSTASADGLSQPNVAMVIHPQMCGSHPGACLFTPALSGTRVLDDCFNPSVISCDDAERGIDAFSVQRAKEYLNMNSRRVVGWLVLLWVPLAFSLPYLLMAIPQGFSTNTVSSIFLILSVSLSAPILALNAMFSRLPIPTIPSEKSTKVSPSIDFEGRYKRSGSVTVVEGRRSGDVWLVKGDAIHSKGGLSRAASLLTPLPKLSVLPQAEYVISEDSRAGSPSPLTMLGDTALLASSPDIISSRNLSKGLGTPCKEENDESAFSFINGSSSVLTETIEMGDCLRPTSERVLGPTLDRDDVVSKSSRGTGRMHIFKENSIARPETIVDVSVMNIPARGPLVGTGSSLTDLIIYELPVKPTASQRPADDALRDRRALRSTTKTGRGMNDLREGSSTSLHLPLTAGLAPRAGGGATIPTTPEGIQRRRSLTSLASFSSPELTSTPPFSSTNRVDSAGLKGCHTLTPSPPCSSVFAEAEIRAALSNRRNSVEDRRSKSGSLYGGSLRRTQMTSPAVQAQDERPALQVAHMRHTVVKKILPSSIPNLKTRIVPYHLTGVVPVAELETASNSSPYLREANSSAFDAQETGNVPRQDGITALPFFVPTDDPSHIVYHPDSSRVHLRLHHTS